MSRPRNLKRLSDAGITSTSDGLLRDFISRGLISAIPAEIDVAIGKREREIEFLKSFKEEFEEVNI